MGLRIDLSQSFDFEVEGSIPATRGRIRRWFATLKREKTPTKLGGRNTFDDALKADVVDLAGEFAESTSLLNGARIALLTPGKTSLLVIEDVMSKSKSIATAEAIAKHVRGLVNFYVELRAEPNVALTGEHSETPYATTSNPLWGAGVLSQVQRGMRLLYGQALYGLSGHSATP